MNPRPTTWSSQLAAFSRHDGADEQNETLSPEADVLSSSIRMHNGTVILPIASDYKGAAGSRHSLVVYDEIWGFESEKARRLYKELTPAPTESSAWILIVTYAGFLGHAFPPSEATQQEKSAV